MGMSTADADTFRRSHGTMKLSGQGLPIIDHENEKTAPVPRKVQAAIYDPQL